MSERRFRVPRYMDIYEGGTYEASGGHAIVNAVSTCSTLGSRGNLGSYATATK